MDDAEYDIRKLVARLQMAHFSAYLLSRGWREKPSRFVDQLYFEGKIHEGEDAYELYLPASKSAAKYQTNVMRAIYKLCGIEDREPAEIARDMLASHIPVEKSEGSDGVRRLRVCNSSSTTLHLRIDSPPREHSMLPGESIELVCHVDPSGLLEVERADNSLNVRSTGLKQS